ncbi:MAG: DUF1266 domain-containing protein [Clostridium sp.]|nr:DUF1266 domain-containing protein [Clostridium sp.]
MRKKSVKLIAALLCCTMMLWGCKSEKAADTKGNSPSSKTETTQAETTAGETIDTEEYTSHNGAYSLTLLPGMESTNIGMGQNISMMLIGGGKAGTTLQSISVGMEKPVRRPSDGTEVASLEDYGDYIERLMEGNGSIIMSWDSTEDAGLEGMVRSFVKKGTIREAGTYSKAYAVYGETESSYYGVMLMGKDKDLERGKDILLINELNPLRAQTTKNFILSMTAVLDQVNGANALEVTKAAKDTAGDMAEYKDALEQMEISAQQGLESSWEIRDRASLEETKADLLSGGHNEEALSLLEDYGIKAGMDRDEAMTKLEQEGADETEKIYMMAAYDAWTAYGESAIKAWDLSRVPTILGMGYMAGYCTYEEALDGALEAAQLAQQSFNSWEDFNQSYLYGYSYWSEEALDDPTSSAYERKNIVEAFDAQVNGPFSLDWNMDLTKEW